MKDLILPKGYKQLLDLKETEIAIKKLKDCFQKELSIKLALTRVSAPLFVKQSTGLNDALNGTEKAISFNVKGCNNESAEIVHSLAKWKRMALYRYGFSFGEGLYTDMNAIRAEEVLDNIHSIYVDQWDWEKVIQKSERNKQKLKAIVSSIYEVFKNTEKYINGLYPELECILPNDIFFVSSQELEDMYPDLTTKQREHAIAKEKGAVFIMQIGGKLESGEKHDGRSPDYDDWNLNGDIIFWFDTLEIGLELSSMGIRVDADALKEQLKAEDCEDRLKYKFHKMILNDELPFTVGGGIGQSRICMFFLKKAHIGEVQASIWPDEMRNVCAENSIELL
ncbi:aspartate--ammonia ligase [Clostridiaceae bacterium M8S5]|nr:aspartate--ammonia ligase [Clostridiaceae bacterium M8S5]